MTVVKWAVLGWMILASVVPVAARDIISGIKTTLELVGPPEVEYRRADAPAIRNEPENRWLKISIEYTPSQVRMEPPALTRERGRLRLNRNGFLDGMSIKLRVLVDSGIKFGTRPVYGMYTGEVTFVTVKRDGKKHLAEMFIPGALIDRFSLSPNGSVRRVSKSDFIIEVVFTAAGREIGRYYSGVTNDRAFATACEMVPDNMVSVGGVYPRSRTPWALLGADGLDPESGSADGN